MTAPVEQRVRRVEHVERWSTPTSPWSGSDPLRRVKSRLPQRETDVTWRNPDEKSEQR